MKVFNLLKCFTISYLLIGAMTTCNVIHAQTTAKENINNTQLPKLVIDNQRQEIIIPNILGYQVLKADLHIHTVFSDGSVWPTIRVDEAWKEGIDVISITDHIEHAPKAKYIDCSDKNAPYNIAKDKANEMGIILLRGGEVTREMSPGHLNAVGISDANLLNKESWEEALDNALRDGAFVFWNHPGWRAQQPDTTLWMKEHEVLYQKGIIRGIEVFNEKEWYPIALDWAIEKGIAPIANSDIHGVAGYFYDYSRYHRPMTLLLASKRNEAGVMDALKNARTIAYFEDILAGDKKYLVALFLESISVERLDSTSYIVKNSSDLRFNLELDGNTYTISPRSTIRYDISNNYPSIINVTNMRTGSKSCLEISPEKLIKKNHRQN